MSGSLACRDDADDEDTLDDMELKQDCGGGIWRRRSIACGICWRCRLPLTFVDDVVDEIDAGSLEVATATSTGARILSREMSA